MSAARTRDLLHLSAARHQMCPPRGHTTPFSSSTPRTQDPLCLSAATRLPAPSFRERIRGVRRADTQPHFIFRRADSGSTPPLSAARTRDLLHLSAARHQMCPPRGHTTPFSSSTPRTQDPLPRCPPRGHAICSTCQRQDAKCVRRADTRNHRTSIGAAKLVGGGVDKCCC